MTSSTLMASRSIRFASIARCLPRMYWPSSTSERSSSSVSGAWPSPSGWILSSLSKPRTNRLTNHTTGVAILSIGASTKLTTGASRSACAAPTTFGVISANTRSANEIAIVPRPSASSPSPNRRLVMTAVSVAAPAATSVLPSRMTPSRRSVCASSAIASFAPRAPRCARCFRRKRLVAIIAVSAIEKKPAVRISTVSTIKSVASGMSSIEPSAARPRATAAPDAAVPCRGRALSAPQHFQHELAAKIGQEQQHRAREDPAQRDTSAPAVAPATPQQRAEHEPRQDREHALVVERERPPEDLLGKQAAACDREREQHEARADQAKQKALEREQRRHPVGGRVGQPPVQPLLESHQHERLHSRDEEQGVGDQRDADVQRGPWRVGVREPMRIAREDRQQHTDAGDGQHDRSDRGQRAQQ